MEEHRRSRADLRLRKANLPDTGAVRAVVVEALKPRSPARTGRMASQSGAMSERSRAGTSNGARCAGESSDSATYTSSFSVGDTRIHGRRGSSGSGMRSATPGIRRKYGNAASRSPLSSFRQSVSETPPVPRRSTACQKLDISIGDDEPSIFQPRIHDADSGGTRN